MASNTVTRAVLRSRLLESLGFLFESTSTGAGAGDGTTIVDTAAVAFNTDRLVGKWVLITSGSASGEERRISSVSSSTITVSAAFSAQIASGVTYSVMPWRPTDVHRALEHGLRTTATDLYLPKRDESLAVDNLVSNWHFETFTVADTPDSWTLTNLSAGTTITEENTRVFQGTSGIKCAPTAGDATVSQNIFTAIEVNEMAGQTLHVRARAWYDGASVVKARVSFDNGSTFTDSSNHSGESEWQRLDIDVTIPTTATTAIVYLFTTNNETAYWDEAKAWVGRLTRYTIPSDIVSLRQVRMECNEDKPNGEYEPLGRVLPGRILRLLGVGRLTIPSSDTATTELDDVQAEAAVARAAARLFQQQAVNDPGSRDVHMQDMQVWESRYDELARRATAHTTKMAADPQRHPWHVEEDGSGRYLVLEGRD